MYLVTTINCRSPQTAITTLPLDRTSSSPTRTTTASVNPSQRLPTGTLPRCTRMAPLASQSKQRTVIMTQHTQCEERTTTATVSPTTASLQGLKPSFPARTPPSLPFPADAGGAAGVYSDTLSIRFL